MLSVFSERIRTALAPPRYLASPLSGIDLSTSGVKVVRLTAEPHGLVLGDYEQVRLPLGVYTDGEVVDQAAITTAISTAAKAAGISSANVSLPESKSYLFETTAPGSKRSRCC